MNKSNWLANIFEWLGEVFERFNPSAFRFLAATLPYLTPFPVAWMTAHSATEFFGFTPTVAFILVYCLEGIGLWFTTLLVDSVVEAVRSRNKKSWLIVGMFAVAVGIYIRILIGMNVQIEAYDAVHKSVITMMCYLPLIVGIGNGYYKLMLKRDTEIVIAKQTQAELDEKIRQENMAFKLEKYRIKTGQATPLPQLNSDTPQVRLNQKKSDWRLLSEEEKREVINVLQPSEIVTKYGVSRSTAFEWKRKSV